MLRRRPGAQKRRCPIAAAHMRRGADGPGKPGAFRRLFYFPATLAQVSFSGTVRLNTGLSAVESLSLQK